MIYSSSVYMWFDVMLCVCIFLFPGPSDL